MTLFFEELAIGVHMALVRVHANEVTTAFILHDGLFDHAIISSLTLVLRDERERALVSARHARKLLFDRLRQESLFEEAALHLLAFLNLLDLNLRV